MDPAIYIAVASIIFLLLIGALIFKKKTGTAEEADDNQVQEAGQGRPAAAPQVGGVRRRNVGARNRMRNRQADSDEEDEDEAAQFDHVALPSGKIGAKKMKKLQEKEERAKQREAELEEREERKRRQEQLDEERQKREEREAAQEAVEEAERQRLKKIKEKEEHEEYLKLKAEFTVDEEGASALLSEQDSESLLQQFITYIKDMKVVMLEDLASHFKLKTQDVIDRIKDLQEAERLSGVLDDRGKFIHITREEYEAVAKFIKQRGRVSITELAEHSNTLINLKPDNQETHSRLVSQAS